MNGHVVYGQALYDAGRHDDAETTFQTALTLDPENLIALRHLGDIAKSKHDTPKAIEWYQRVLDADPRNDEILGFLDELKAAEAARTPTPVMTPVVTPLETPVVPAARPSVPTPVAPVAAAPPPEPPKRPSIGLMDLAVDFGSEPAAPAPAPAHEAPAAPIGDIEINDRSFDRPAAEAPAPPPPGFEEPVLDIPRDMPAADDAINFGTTDVDLTSSAGNLHAFDRPLPPPTGTPEVFVTETMAELYLQQGFRDEALQVYRQLAELHPNDESIKDRIRHLESGDRASMSFAAISFDVAPAGAADPPSAPANAPADDLMLGDISLPPMDAIAHGAPAAVAPFVPATPAQPVLTARMFFAALAQRRPVRADGTPPVAAPAIPAPAPEPVPAVAVGGSLDTLFGGAAPDAADDAMGRALATAVAVEESAPIRGRPTQQATTEFSLDSVFRGGDTVARTSAPTKRPSEVLTFDQFFSAGGAEPAEPPAAPIEPAASPADDAQFNQWLKGLKGQ